MDTASLDPRLRDDSDTHASSAAVATANGAAPSASTTTPAKGGASAASPDVTAARGLDGAAGAKGHPLYQELHQLYQGSSPATTNTPGAHHHQGSTPSGTAQSPAASSATAGHHNPLTPYAASSAFSPQTPSSTAPTPVAQQSSYAARRDSSGVDATPDGEGTPGGHGDPNDPKKPRACESCRGLKVRCDPDPANPDGPCKRCAKAGRACVVTQPTRKRQKKTDSRVAELEKKIDALTASLQATRSSGPSGPGQQSAAVASAGGPVPAGNAGAGASAASAVTAPMSREETAAAGSGAYGLSVLARDWAAQTRDTTQAARMPSTGAAQASYAGSDRSDKSFQPPMVMAGQKRKFTETRDTAGDDIRERAAPIIPANLTSSSMANEYSDIIDRGIITMTLANELFARYTDQMVQHLPGVVFPAGTTAAEIRKTKPILFLSIMGAASSEMPNIQRQLTKELMQIIAEKSIVVGEKSLELVQAIQVATIWYWPPEHFEELKFYSLVHIAGIMAIDLGLGRKKQNKGGFKKHIPGPWQNHPWRKNPPPDPTTIESRRAWLTCYFLATNTSMALHRPNLIRWTSFMAECIDILESSPEAAPTDKYLCHLVWTHKLSEDVGMQFAMDDPEASVNIADARTQYALKGFERDLEKYSASIPEELQQPTLKLSFHVLSLYMHEIATQNEFGDDCRGSGGCNAEAMREAFAAAVDTPLTPAHISAISACLTAVDGIFEVFLSMDVQSIRCLPVFNFVRVAYAVVILIKMYFAASYPKSELGKVINKDNMKVEQHIENLLEKFRATAAEEKSRPAAKFLVVLVMLRSWFQKQSQPEGASAAGAANAAGRPNEKGATTQAGTAGTEFNRSTANAGLQLLSEIATNETGTTPRPTGDLWRPPPPPFGGVYDSADTPGTGSNTGGSTDGATPHAQPHLGPSNGQAPMPWLNNAFSTDFDYSSLGDGFQQAMDLTLAGMTDGSFGLGLENGMSFVMQQPPWMPGLMMGMGLEDMFAPGSNPGTVTVPQGVVAAQPGGTYQM